MEWRLMRLNGKQFDNLFIYFTNLPFWVTNITYIKFRFFEVFSLSRLSITHELKGIIKTKGFYLLALFVLHPLSEDHMNHLLR
jgi:hypothetical protein